MDNVKAEIEEQKLEPVDSKISSYEVTNKVANDRLTSARSKIQKQGIRFAFFVQC